MHVVINAKLRPQIRAKIEGIISRGVKEAEIDGNGHLIFTLTDGSTVDLGSVVGPQGEQGETGETGNGIESTVLNANYTLTLNFTDGTSYTTTSIRGAQGDDGVSVTDFSLISGTHAPGTSDTYRMTLSDGTTYDVLVYNGANGEGTGDMTAAVYDPSGGVADAGGIAGYVADTVSGKQDTISDLETIRSGAALGATAVQSVKTVNGQSIAGTGNLTVRELPAVIAADEGKFLRVVSGAAAWQTVPQAEDEAF